jgi:hypothetical protein
MLTVSFFLIAAAFVATIVSAIGKCPLWVAVLLLCVWALLSVLPR